MQNETLTYDSIYAKFRTLLCWQLGCIEDNVQPKDSLLDELGADSLDIEELILEAETAFDLSIPDEDAVTLTTPEAWTNYLLEHLTKPATA